MIKLLKLTLLLTVLFYGCKPPAPKLEIIKEEKGLNCTQINVLINGQSITNPFVSLDDTLEMSFAGLSGFRSNGNIVYPGGTLTVKDEKGEVIFKLDDVFIDLDECGADIELVKKNISMFLETGSPMKKGETYTWENVIWDKRANRKITGTAKITIQ